MFGGVDGRQGQAQPADIGFGYINNGAHDDSNTVPAGPASPLKSALKVPGTPARKPGNVLSPSFMSPTFAEETNLEKREKATDEEQARDFVSASPAASPWAASNQTLRELPC